MPDPIVTQNPGGDQSNGGQNTNGAPNPNANATGGETNRVAGGNGGGAGTKFSYDEDRSSWIDPSKLKHRLTEVEKRAADRKAAELEAHYKGEIDSREAKIRALAGVAEVPKEEAETREMRDALERVYPELKVLRKLSDDKFFDKLADLQESASSMKSAAADHYEKIAGNMIGNLHSEVAEAIGGDLTDRQKKSLARLYKDEAEACMYARENDPEHDTRNDFLSRHQRGDDTLIKELAKGWVEDWFEPARRQATSGEVQRYRPTPKGGRGNPVTVQRPKPDLTKPGAFEEAMANARREDGGGFGSR